ncbi:SflA family class IV lanthipeptide [Kitasatospora sp. NPDC057904]|uniref:SflA family class IV lanthipeptide n=1 Tax=unclassified Kitasatospora TaxID=2633591 RepID=UPI0036650CEB
MTASMLEIHDAGLLEIDEAGIVFEDEFDADLAPAACLADPFVTWVPTRFPCGGDS